MIRPTRYLQAPSLSAPLFYFLPENLQYCNIIVYSILFIFCLYLRCNLGKNLKKYFGAFYFSRTTVAAVYTFQLQTFHPNETVNKKKSRKCKKQGIKNFLCLCYIQVKYGDIADKNPYAADDD